MHPSILSKYIRYVSLNILGMIGISVYILADTFFIAQALGEKGIAALNFSIPVFSVIYGFGLMLGLGGATKYSIAFAQGRHNDANRLFTNVLKAGLVIGMAFIVIGVVAAKELGHLLGSDPTTLPLTTIYLTTIMSFSPLLVINQILMTFVRNDKNPNLPMVAMLVGSLVNIVLDYIFVFPLQMGMFGAALATGASPIISLVLLSTHLFDKDTSLKLKKSNFQLLPILEVSKIGIPAWITELSSSIILITFNRVIFNLEGTLGVASYGIIANIALVVNAMFIGVAQGVQPLISSSFGKNDHHSLFQLKRYSFVTSLAISLLVYVVLWLGGPQIVQWFNKTADPNIAQIAGKGIQLYFTGFFFAGLNIILTIFWSSTEKNKSAFILSLGRGFVLLVPIVLLMSSIWGMNGVWLSFLVTEMVIFILAAGFARHIGNSAWKKRVNL